MIFWGAQKYSGRVLPKIPYGTKAVKDFVRTNHIVWKFIEHNNTEGMISREKIVDTMTRHFTIKSSFEEINESK